MALPKINAFPKYKMNIPSTGKEVRFRPFLVKEEKILMMAMESNDTAQMLDSIVDTLDACIEEGFDKKEATTFDVEYMFTKLRAKSVGETAEVSVKCDDCEEENEIVIDVDSIALEVPQLEKIIEIDDNIRVEVQWPSYRSISRMNPDNNQTDQMFAILRACLVAVHTEDERIDLVDVAADEIQEFIESMHRSQFSKIQTFIESMPSLKHDVEFKCSKCEKDNSIELQGMQSFF